MFCCDQCGECCRHLLLSPLYAGFHDGDGICRYLEGNRCSIYEDRPLICRVDECYEAMFKGTMAYEDYLQMNYACCALLKQKKEEVSMPLPFILGAAAAVAGAVGIGAGIKGAKKLKEANDTMEEAKRRHEANMAHFEEENKTTSLAMDKLGTLELEILNSFKTFADTFETIKNRPHFAPYEKNGVVLPKYDGEQLKEVSIGAGVLLGRLGGAGLGTAGGFAAAGATTAAVMALGTASTGTAIASLSGAALTNATLAALGGGAVAAGGGGIALGTTILGAATLGVGLLVGGVIFNFTGEKISDKADEAWQQMEQAEEKMNAICAYLLRLRHSADQYYDALSAVNAVYQKHLNGLTAIVSLLGHDDWHTFTAEEKKLTENTVLLVGLLYQMCKVELVLKSDREDGINAVNTKAIDESIRSAKSVMDEHFAG